jgi:hypothetical protein
MYGSSCDTGTGSNEMQRDLKFVTTSYVARAQSDASTVGQDP